MPYKSIFCLLVFLWPLSATCEHRVQAVNPFHPDRATVEAQYDAATLGLDLSRGLRWQFYWSANRRKRLTELADEKKTKKFIVIEASQDANGRFRLQLEKIAILSVADLIAWNQTFFEGAKESGSGQVYEGWSVEPRNEIRSPK